ncbi:MAG: 5'-nucleotidase, lipoprotein e(P4) family [Succiniclasticum sp.]|jgi:5'-nucleotidase (lipoprotein e(P4) family)
MRRKWFRAVTIGLIFTLGLSSVAMAADAETFKKGKGDHQGNILTMAVAWKQTAAEYGALYHQAFNIAKDRVDAALAAQKPGDPPLCVVTDVDDTILLHPDYWGSLVAHGYDGFYDPLWDIHIAKDKILAAPGSKEFLDYCKSKGVEVFYVTSRDQGAKTTEYALKNLTDAGFPYADKDHVTVLIDTSNKEKVQHEIAKTHRIAVYLGDSLNDFRRIYYVKDVAQRYALMEADKDQYGRRFIVLPNPTDGHWVRAIFGESEPAPTKENRKTWKKAAAGHTSPAIEQALEK